MVGFFSLLFFQNGVTFTLCKCAVPTPKMVLAEKPCSYRLEQLFCSFVALWSLEHIFIVNGLILIMIFFKVSYIANKINQNITIFSKQYIHFFYCTLPILYVLTCNNNNILQVLDMNIHGYGCAKGCFPIGIYVWGGKKSKWKNK